MIVIIHQGFYKKKTNRALLQYKSNLVFFRRYNLANLIRVNRKTVANLLLSRKRIRDQLDRYQQDCCSSESRFLQDGPLYDINGVMGHL